VVNPLVRAHDRTAALNRNPGEGKTLTDPLFTTGAGRCVAVPECPPRRVRPRCCRGGPAGRVNDPWAAPYRAEPGDRCGRASVLAVARMLGQSPEVCMRILRGCSTRNLNDFADRLADASVAGSILALTFAASMETRSHWVSSATVRVPGR